MKSSPAKGILSNFFSNLGSQLKSNRKDIGAEMKDKYSSKAQRADKVAKSKAKRNMVDKNKDNVSDFVQPHSITDPTPKHMTSTVSSKPKSKGYVPQEFKGKAGDKYRYRRTGTIKKGDKDFREFEFMPWDKEKGFGDWTKAEPVKGNYKGKNMINELYKEALGKEELFDSPIDKKSPSKKRGYKMKNQNSPAKNYKKGYYGA